MSQMRSSTNTGNQNTKPGNPYHSTSSTNKRSTKQTVSVPKSYPRGGQLSHQSIEEYTNQDIDELSKESIDGTSPEIKQRGHNQQFMPKTPVLTTISNTPKNHSSGQFYASAQGSFRQSTAPQHQTRQTSAVSQHSYEEMMAYIESRFENVEKRLETNEHLVHLNSEMAHLKQDEVKNIASQENHRLLEIERRIDGMDKRMKVYEESLAAFQTEIDHKVDDLTSKVEGSISIMSDQVTRSGRAVDEFLSLQQKAREKEGRERDDVIILGNRLTLISEEVREQMKNICTTLEAVGMLAHETNKELGEHKKVTKSLEDDLVKLLALYREGQASKIDAKWLGEELATLKSKQGQIISIIDMLIDTNSKEIEGEMMMNDLDDNNPHHPTHSDLVDESPIHTKVSPIKSKLSPGKFKK